MVGDDPACWAAAGFSVDGEDCRVANTVVSLVGPERGRGIVGAELDDIEDHIDGMPFGAADHHAAPDPPRIHANGVVAFDHLVAMSPDMDRTTAALTAAGLEHRRTRTFEVGGRTRRQAFFWMGDVILELVGDDAAHDDGPARLWGLAFTCGDLQAAARRLGDGIGEVTPAVQPGREIATVRTKALDISVPIALMSPHPNDTA